ncbi:MAG TPA: hypothetical protein VM925_35305 [Labilithrix sp.]|nr:hypothetical protein [Labilithrix sp.]
MTEHALDHLDKLPVVSVSKDAKPTIKEYVSHSTQSPGETFRSMTSGLEKHFNAAGIKVVRRNEDRPLAHGDRFYLIPKHQPVLMPCRVNIDPSSRRVTIETLGHHPFQGTNVFEAKHDGKGGSLLVQTATFQASSKSMSFLSGTSLVDKPQNKTWRLFHKQVSHTPDSPSAGSARAEASNWRRSP